MSPRGQIFLVLWGVIFMALYGIACIFVMHLWPPPSPLRPDDEVAQFYLDNSVSLRVGACVALAVAGFNIPIASVVTYQMVRLGRRVLPWAIVHAMGSAMMTMWLALPPMLWGGAAFTPERAPALTRLMSDFAWLAFITSISHFVFQACAFAYVCLSRKVDSPYFPRWLGYLTVWSFAITEIGVFAMLIKEGPFAWNGLFGFWSPVIAAFLWWYAMAYVFVKNLRTEVAAGDAGDADHTQQAEGTYVAAR